VVCALNCHHVRWLRFSSNISPEGKCLERCCLENGLHQAVKEPTRGEYLLDLVLTDLDEVTARVLPCIADHHGVLAKCTFSVDAFTPRARSVWNFRSADWIAMCEHVASLDFSFIELESVDMSAQKFTDMILSVCDTFVSKRTLLEGACSHPWITERCRLALAEKHNAYGTPDYADKCLSYSLVLREEFDSYVVAVKKRLSRLRPGSKHFWSLSKKLLLGAVKATVIPALKSQDGSWVRLPGEKANLFADTFRGKWCLPLEQQNFYSFQRTRDYVQQRHFLQIRSRSARFDLSSLECASSTGPDGLPTILLRGPASVLCFFSARLVTMFVKSSLDLSI